MPELALALLVLYGVVALGARMVLHRRRTGSSGFIGAGEAPVERVVAVLFVASFALLVAAPILDLAGALDPIGALDGSVGHAIGGLLAVTGIAAVALAQGAMGKSWRIGVDPAERTGLVTGGPFFLARNPIYTAMIATFAGIALLVPSIAALAGLIALIAALELQTRVVEEPYLLGVHGDEYAHYAGRIGRFVPWVGRLSQPTPGGKR
jgi:protein-S-isoprenylcysteine O-methyltransferase Ste14